MQYCRKTSQLRRFHSHHGYSHDRNPLVTRHITKKRPAWEEYIPNINRNMAEQRGKKAKQRYSEVKIKWGEILVGGLSTCSFTFQSRTSEALRVGCDHENHHYSKMCYFTSAEHARFIFIM